MEDDAVEKPPEKKRKGQKGRGKKAPKESKVGFPLKTSVCNNQIFVVWPLPNGGTWRS